MTTQVQSLCIGAVGGAIALVGLVSAPVLAQPSPALIAQRGGNKIIYVRREVSGPAPGGRYRGGGSRSGGSQTLCPVTKVPLTALVPFQESYEKGQENLPPMVNVWGYAASDRPTFWVYVPYNTGSIPARFSMDDETAGNTIYETAVKLPNQAGIVGIPLPADAPALQPGKRYRWFFSLNCKAPNATAATTENINVEAVVIREALPAAIARQLTSAPSLQNAIAFAQNGFWYDALTTLAKLRQQNPQDESLTLAWKELLSGVATSEAGLKNFNLDAIQAQPLVNE
jgi:hypothetical protein